MLKYVEELKKYVDEMLIWDGKVKAAKYNLRVKSKTATKEEIEQLKAYVRGTVAFKVRSYLELCAFIDRNNILWGKDFLRALPGYKGEGYALVAERFKKEIMDEYVIKNRPMTQNIAHLVDMEKLFEKSTGAKWVTMDVDSPYTFVDRQDIAGTRYPCKWRLLVNEKYAEMFKGQTLTPEMIKEYILDGRCVLLRDLQTEDGEKAIEDKYIFDLSMDTIGNSIYEKMYPNLRYNFWELFDERTIARIQNEIKHREGDIDAANDLIKESRHQIERKQDDIKKLKELLDDVTLEDVK